ncbi:5621_t:CDS:1, partial [Cetraspora pellucida]
MTSLPNNNLYKINEDNSISCLQENCSYKNRTPKNNHNSIIQHYSRCHKTHYKFLKYNTKPYSKPQQKNISSYAEEHKLIDKNNIPDFNNYKNKTLISIIYRYILISFIDDINLDIKITNQEHKLFNLAFKEAISAYKFIETSEITLKKYS